MYIENDTIHFESSKLYYDKEKTGLKKNTVRVVSDKEYNIILDVIENLKYISIHKSNERFIREITDISIVKKHTYFMEYIIIYIFSWA